MELSTVQNKTMSSKEVAELTGKQHSNVLRDIRNMIEQINNSNENYQDFQGLTVEYCPQTKRASIYHLDEDMATCLVTGYDAAARMAVIKRWKELESAKPKELSRRELLTMNLEALDKIDALESDKAVLQEVAQNLTAQFTTGLTPPEFCKQLNGVNVQKVQSYLCDKGILRKGNGDIKGYLVAGKYRDKYFKQDYEQYKDSKRGFVLVLPDGAKWLYKKYHKGELAMKTTWDNRKTHDLYLPTQPSLALEAVL